LANYSVAEIPAFGHLAGCDFWDLGKPCIVDGEVPDYSKGFFCNTLSGIDLTTFDASGPYECDPAHKHKAICDLFDAMELNLTLPPQEYQYFPNKVRVCVITMLIFSYS